MNQDRAFQDLIEDMVGPDALPAGGAAGIVAIAMGVALGTKMIRLSGADSDLTAANERLLDILESLKPEFSEDCAAFSQLLSVMKIPKNDPERLTQLRAAWSAAVDAPVRAVEAAREALSLLREFEGRVKPSMASDLLASLDLVRAGLSIAERNARENAHHLPEDEKVAVLQILDSTQDEIQ